MIRQQLILILMLSLVAGCGTYPPAQPTSIPEPTATDIPEPTEVAESASPGELLFSKFISETGFSCQTCHYPNSDDRLIGPGLLNIEERFETYTIDVENIKDYIKQSIEDPGAFIVPHDPPYPANIMPRIYGDIFTDDEMDLLVDYILSAGK